MKNKRTLNILNIHDDFTLQKFERFQLINTHKIIFNYKYFYVYFSNWVKFADKTVLNI